MKKVWICGIITVLCIIATVLLRKPMDNAELDYQEVQVRVVSSESKSYSYLEGRDVTAYLYNGKLYANEEGVRSASTEGIAYSVALIASFGMFVATMVMLSKSGQKK